MDRLFSFWIDRGGTFTDVIGRADDGAEVSAKLLSASPAYPDAAVEAMRRILGAAPGAPFPAACVTAIKMGTTVATNALLERAGAKTLFVTTEGFADALLIGDQARPDLFALNIDKPPPLHAGVVEAAERLAADGAVVRPLDQDALRAKLQAAVAEGFTSVAIAFLHADLNPAHEWQAGEIARAAGFAFVALSSEVSPLPRFIPRAETTVADAYLTPVLQAYVRRVADAVAGAPLYFMTSAGGLVRAEAFRGRDAVVSGPAGGVVGVARTAAEAGADAVLGFDMGGTSTDVCRFAGTLERRDTARVAGVRLRSPMLDVETVAAGGGSVLTFDGMRARAGPASAGADPGPACYGRGGPAAVTDANLVLGRLDPRFFPAVFGPKGDAALDPAASRVRLEALARAMGAGSVEAAAEGFVAVAVEQMAQAVRRISTERGFDPREHALVAFGGAAGQVACQTAEALGVEQVLCPKYGSVLSAWGIGQAQVTALRQAGIEAPLESGLDAARAALETLDTGVRADMAAQGAEASDIRRTLRLRYDGADAELPVALSDVDAARATFEASHQRLFGFIEPDRPILIAAVEAEAISNAASNIPHPREGGDPDFPSRAATQDHSKASLGPRMRGDEAVRMFALGAWHDAPVVAAETLSQIDGPALVVRADTQIAVLPGWRAAADANGLIRLTRAGAVARQTIALDKPDPVTLELFNRRFMGVAEAMGAALERTAHSVNIKERLDFSCALFDADGGLVANAPHMPVHLGSMGASVRAVRDRHPDLKPGQAFALNNPYAGGTHLPDITVVMPVFMDQGDAPNRSLGPSFYVAARGHHADVGGIQPGSMPPFSHTIDEEGVMLDAVPIMRDGRFLDAETRAALATGRWPARAPDRNLADLKAQVASCQAGAGAVAEMIRTYGAQAVARYMGFVQDNAAEAVRRAVGKLSDGEARVPMDGGGEIVVRTTVDAAAREAVLDFTGSADQLDSNFNAPSAIVDAAALYVFRTLVDDDIPLNAGCLKPLKILTRDGSMLAPHPPAAVVAGNVETSQHVVDALYAALGVMANSQGSMNNFTFGDEVRQYYETICGGAGATATHDGASAIHTHMTNSRLTDPEILERRFPVRVEAFGVRANSGGAGARRGGDGALRRIRFLAPMEAALLSSRRENAPQGLAGGGPGSAGRQRLIATSGAATELPGCFSVTVELGDLIEIETPGGGGYGLVE
ncbi:MAG: hydantoinase B/oxoprolinase family protein [Alphaproteobacteria bacterium]|nr:hydantoinase B/oxoprolinase family protein [Alphaproteobacteria bacterium]MBU1516366.1 hydantoinase B/oxoprolinase family protein [Alphaproteobacteria bacterium]MBU2093397.1 hydantoinase B/oxoprolinase family protein [Alphaproteobacteria bacterium]MBU2153884.1 hydantoinase B/oxoprolinase family protein [Alphaproteobacteria bacterium]MBU2307756.1 hydantoinase B/oxoprolinase family protein [Alphaproteobacteria bacterium]